RELEVLGDAGGAGPRVLGHVDDHVDRVALLPAQQRAHAVRGALAPSLHGRMLAPAAARPGSRPQDIRGRAPARHLSLTLTRAPPYPGYRGPSLAVVASGRDARSTSRDTGSRRKTVRNTRGNLHVGAI